ncbi:MAG: SPFH domain-containing protein [Lentisphaeraceae bacterium]|nr:SPFH domain-containing protein [Lentisphaeraceae bacterium]
MADHSHNHDHDHSHDHKHEPSMPVNEGAESLVGALKFLFFGLRVAMVILVVLLFRTGCFTVQPSEQVLTYRFGEMQVNSAGESVFSSGDSRLNWVWPKPIGNTLTLPAGSIPQTVEASRFWEQKSTAVVNQQNEDGKDSAEAFMLGKEGYVITGDSYMYHIKASMTYYIRRADEYYDSFYKLNESGGFDQQASEALAKKVLSSHLEQALTMETTRWKLDSAFYNEINDFRQQLLLRVKEDVEKLGYGIEVDRIDIKSDDRAAVRQVRGTFNKVSVARAKSQADVNEAKQAKSRIQLEASQKATQTLADAEVYRKKIVSRLNNLKSLDSKDDQDINLMYIYVDAMSKLLEKIDHRFVIRKDTQGRDTYWLELGPEKQQSNKDEEDASKEGK